MARILIIEDEEVLRSSMVKGITKLPGVEVVDAGSINDALTFIDHSINLIISDIDLPDGSGIEIIGELGKRGLRIPVIFASGYLRAYRTQIPPHANVAVLEKPFSFDELRSIIQEKLGDSDAAVDAPPFSVADYLQLACMGQHSVIIDVSEGGEGNGQIVVSSGKVWAASDEQGTGESAFRRLVLKAGKGVRCQTLTEDPGERNIEGDWKWLLMDVVRNIDEDKAGIQSGPRTDDIADVEFDLLSSSEGEASKKAKGSVDGDAAFNEAFERGLDALFSRDYREALNAFLTAERIRPGDTKVQANIQRLREMGYEEESQ